MGLNDEEWWQEAIQIRDVLDPDGDPGDYTGITWEGYTPLMLFQNRPRAETPLRVADPLRSRVPPAHSAIEEQFWATYLQVRPRALKGLVRQQPVGHYRIDFAIPRRRIGIELDGFASHSSTEDIASDRYRQRRLEEAGWYIIRFSGLEVHRNVEACIREAAHLVSIARWRR
jgi:very-short-patch-repair endonuclease